MAMKDVAPDSLAIIFAHRKNPSHIRGCVHTWTGTNNGGRWQRSEQENCRVSYKRGARDMHTRPGRKLSRSDDRKIENSGLCPFTPLEGEQRK